MRTCPTCGVLRTVLEEHVETIGRRVEREVLVADLDCGHSVELAVAV